MLNQKLFIIELTNRLFVERFVTFFSVALDRIRDLIF
jgi:hypothetical protein